MKLKYLKNVVKLSLDKEKCIGCGMCIDVCPHNVYKIENKKAEIIDINACMECGACKINCPVGAIDVKMGVGCAAAIYKGFFSKSEPCCGPSSDDSNSGCC
jgi:ferredoxin